MPITTDDPTTPREPKPYDRPSTPPSVVRERAAEYQASPDPAPISLDEYLAAEETAEFPSEYVDGEVVAMTTPSVNHGLIVQKFANALSARLGNGRCEVVSQGTRVLVRRTDNAFLPDIVVFCGAPEVERRRGELLLNPTVLVEVLSPSTADYDHGTKWENYRRIPSLHDYLLVSQDEPRVERYTRHAEGMWMFSEVSGWDAVVRLESIAAEVALRDVYARVLSSADASAGDPRPDSK